MDSTLNSVQKLNNLEKIWLVNIILLLYLKKKLRNKIQLISTIFGHFFLKIEFSNLEPETKTCLHTKNKKFTPDGIRCAYD